MTRLAARLPAAAALALVLALTFSRRESHAYRAALASAIAHARLAQLAGADLSSLSLPSTDGAPATFTSSHARGVLAWFIHPVACPSCLAEAPRWQTTVQAYTADAKVVLVGVGRGRAEQLQRQYGFARPVAYDSAGSALPVSLERLGNLKVLIDPHGIVLAVGKRGSCGPRFEDLVRRLREFAQPEAQAGSGFDDRVRVLGEDTARLAAARGL